MFDLPAKFLAMARGLIGAGKLDTLEGLARKALAERGDDPLVRAIVARIAVMAVPRFHSSMLRDGPRNAAYRQALEAEAPGKVVLDIGTGSGLLAMMAVRAGAAHVYACEHDARLAATAREIVARNGLADKVTVIAANSTLLNPETDLGGGVDMVVSEIFSADLLSEGLLPSLRDAEARLCRPGASFLPARASVRVALYDWVDDSPESLDAVEGFDLSPFHRHIEQEQRCKPDDLRLVLRSLPADLFSFGFPGDHAAEDRAAITLHSIGRRVSGVVQWIGFASESGHAYENAPGPDAAGGHWALMRYPLEAPRLSEPGEDFAVYGWRDEGTVLCWAMPA
jgi:type II protein arginine methyltransferase